MVLTVNMFYLTILSAILLKQVFENATQQYYSNAWVALHLLFLDLSLITSVLKIPSHTRLKNLINMFKLKQRRSLYFSLVLCQQNQWILFWNFGPSENFTVKRFLVHSSVLHGELRLSHLIATYFWNEKVILLRTYT